MPGVELWLLGTTHDDPLARFLLRSWLSHRSFRYQQSPTFVAPEWDEQQFTAMKAERPYMQELLRDEWGSEASDVLIDLCARSVAYEGDAHRDDLFAEKETETYWLEPEDRRWDAHRWVIDAGFPIYRDRLRDKSLAKDPYGALARLQEQSYCWADKADPNDRKKYRDKCWAERLIERLKKEDVGAQGAWAAAVVGAIHATRYDGETTASLLDAAGVKYRVRYLGWPPPKKYNPIGL